MKIYKTPIKDLLIVRKKSYVDNRGFVKELIRENIIKKKFNFQILTKSRKNVLRGLHLQKRHSQAKYISVLSGKILDVAVDLRKNSRTFGKHFSIILESKNNVSFYIPEGFAHGFCALQNNTLIHYNCSNYRDADSEIGLTWNDKDLNISWPVKKPILSKKDKNNITLSEYIKIL